MPPWKAFTGLLDTALVAVRYPVQTRKQPAVWHLAEVVGTVGHLEYRSVCGAHRRFPPGHDPGTVRVPAAVRGAAFVGLDADLRCQRCLQVLGQLRGVLPTENYRRRARSRLARGQDISDSYDEWMYDPDGGRW